MEEVDEETEGRGSEGPSWTRDWASSSRSRRSTTQTSKSKMTTST